MTRTADLLSQKQRLYQLPLSSNINLFLSVPDAAVSLNRTVTGHQRRTDPGSSLRQKIQSAFLQSRRSRIPRVMITNFSVARWIDYVLNIWPFTTMKISKSSHMSGSPNIFTKVLLSET